MTINPLRYRIGPRRRIGQILIFALLVAAGCKEDAPDKFQERKDITGDGGNSALLISAASSLTNAFQELGPAFTSRTKIPVILNFGASGQMLRQIEQGAPADILASADMNTVDEGIRKSLLDRSRMQFFARNELLLVTPRDSRVRVPNVYWLLRDNVKHVAIGDPQFVPAGRYAKWALEELQLYWLLERKLIPANSVRQALQYVVSGEVEAAFVYRTDFKLKEDSLELIQALRTPPIAYPAILVRKSKHRKQSILFLEFLRNAPEARAILDKYGFVHD